MKTKLFRRITVAIIATLLVSTTVVATFATFTNDSETNIAITSGNVEVVATLEDLKLYSPALMDVDGQLINSDNAASSKEFANGGTAGIEEGTLTLSEIVSGDKAEFNIKITNKSSVTVKYRTVLTISNDGGLFDGLVVKIGSTYDGNELSTDWKTLEVGSKQEVIECSVELPTTADKTYMKKTCAISFAVEAVQSNIYIPEGVETLPELKTEIANGKGDSADNPLTIIGGEWGMLGSWDSESPASIEGLHVNIDGGKFEGTAIVMYPGEGVVTITGGTFEVSHLAVFANDVDIYITGGNFVVTYTTNLINCDGEYVGALEISGGTFNFNPTEYVVDGYTALENGDGTWTVVKNA